ncbi:MAG: hypothetical protein HQM12_14930 [SAR324 cluster bacterium]|nr:hypothetical protein [SAR324 cluster bacterium]
MKIAQFFLILFSFTFLLGSCSEDADKNCQNLLDEQRYSEVANASACDNYERASAYLGLAGFGFASFLTEDATDNLSKTLGLDQYTEKKGNLEEWKDNDKGVLQYYEKALCLVGPDSFVQVLIDDGKCESGNRNITENRARRELEISFFGILGELIVRMYGELDIDRDGTISEDELNQFSGVDSSVTVSNSEASSLTPDNDIFQMVMKNGTVYLMDNNNGKCLFMNKNFTGVVPSNFNTTASVFSCPITTASDISRLVPLIKVDSLTNIFSSGVDFTVPLTFLNVYVQRAVALDEDLSDIGFAEDSEFRKAMNESVEKLDNGGTCDNTASRIFGLIESIARNAATSSTNLSQKNLLSISEIRKLNSTVTIPSVNCGKFIPGCKAQVTDGRLIYKKSSGVYTDYYLESDQATIESALSTVLELTTESNVTSGTREITFQELLCLSEE